MKRINWKYAIGEIIIVIIGITIAFSLNNWKANREDKAIKQQYLQNLAIDINQELEHLEANKTAFNGKLADILTVQPFLGNPAMRRDTIIQKFFGLAQLENFNPQNTTYQTLINSGDMKLIDNFELRKNIEAHYAFHDIVNKDYTRIEKIHEKYLGDLFIHDIDYDKLRAGNLDFLDNPILKNIITSIQGSYYMLISSNDKCIESNKTLLEEIALELKK